MNEMIRTVATYTGIGGIALIALLILFREMIRKTIFPQLTKQQAYQLLRLIVLMVTVVVLASIIAWAVTQNGTPQPTPEEPRELPVAELNRPAVDGREMELNLNSEINAEPPEQRKTALVRLHSAIRDLSRQFKAPGEVWAIRSKPLKRPPANFRLECDAFESQPARVDAALYLLNSERLAVIDVEPDINGVVAANVTNATSGDELFFFVGVYPNGDRSLATNPQHVRLVAHP